MKKLTIIVEDKFHKQVMGFCLEHGLKLSELVRFLLKDVTTRGDRRYLRSEINKLLGGNV